MKRTTTILCLIALLPSASAFGQTVFAEGLQLPERMIFTAQGNILVSEGGTAARNTGRVSLVDRQGTRRSLLEGLPAGPAHGFPAFGPTGMALAGRTLYLLLGEGDVEVGPPFSLNPNGPSSPLFHSVLRIQFSADVDAITSSFRMTLEHQWGLSDGNDVELENDSGQRATVHLLTIFPSVVPNILGGAARFRVSDPYAAWLDAANNTLYVVDASAETLVKVNTITGQYLVLTRFQPEERAGPQYVDNVPTAACPLGDSFLVSFLSASPFPAGASSVKRWNPSDGTWSRPSPLIGDLTMTTDMICLPAGAATAPRVVTVESQTIPGMPSGRVQLIDGSERRIIMNNLGFPTTVARDPVSGDLFVAGLSGRIWRAPLP